MDAKEFVLLLEQFKKYMNDQLFFNWIFVYLVLILMCLALNLQNTLYNSIRSQFPFNYSGNVFKRFIINVINLLSSRVPKSS